MMLPVERWKYSFDAEDEEVAEASARLRHGPRNSIRNGGGSFVGYLAQIVVSAVTGIGETTGDRLYDHDLWDGTEVKACERTVAAQPEFCGHIELSQRQQAWRRAIFASAYQDRSRGGLWVVELCGEITKPEWMALARFVRRGEADPMDPARKPMLADCHNLLYSEMQPPDLGRGKDAA